MRKSFLALLALVASAAWASTAGADPGYRPATAIHARSISAAQALKSASVPGAVTEVAPGLTLRQAVGLDPVSVVSTGAVTTTATTAASTACWQQHSQNTWEAWTVGWWQELDDDTTFCGSGGVLTYRSSHASQYQSLCAPTGTYGFKIAGGVGSAWVEWRDGGTWHCQSPYPWLSSYPNDWMDIYADGGGFYSVYETD